MNSVLHSIKIKQPFFSEGDETREPFDQNYSVGPCVVFVRRLSGFGLGC
jgi:hypothetical protein